MIKAISSQTGFRLLLLSEKAGAVLQPLLRLQIVVIHLTSRGCEKHVFPEVASQCLLSASAGTTNGGGS